MYKSLTSFLPNILGLIGFYESKILEISQSLTGTPIIKYLFSKVSSPRDRILNIEHLFSLYSYSYSYSFYSSSFYSSSLYSS